jgi:two-component system NtrC family sensor kinase
LLLVGVGLGVTAVLSAAGGTLVVTGLSPAFPHTFGLCWAADAMGMVLLAPPLVAARLPRKLRAREAEAGLWVAVGAAFVYAVYAGALAPPVALAASYAVFPLVLGVALRFGAALTGAVVASVAGVALGCTGLGSGPFAQASMVANVLSLHAQLAMLGLTGLTLAAARSERDHADERSREHLRALAKAGRLDAISSMAAGIAHELNQPLSAVNSYAHAAQRMLRQGHDATDVDHALERVVSGNERAAAIVRRVRTFLHNDDEHRSPADLNALAGDALQLVAPEYRRERVALISERWQAPLWVAVDAVAIRQVIVNLLQNALDAVDEAAGKREVRLITRPSRNEPDWAELQIADSGPGLPDEGIEELFEPLVTHRAGGTGLGLAIVRSLVAAHEGEVEAKAALGGGALLVVRLPLTAAQEEAA